MQRRYGSVEILFGFLGFVVVVAVIGFVAIFGVSVFGVTRIVQSVTNLIGGRRKETPRMQAPQAQQAGTPHRVAQRPAPAPQPRSYEYFDVDAGATAERISEVMHSYVGTRVIGFYAREVTETLNRADLNKKALFSEIDAKFSPKSISWDHFASTAQEALDAILRNCALLANRVQTFDVSDYEQMEQYYRTGGEMRNGPVDPARVKRWELLRATKDEMDNMRSANEALLLELNKLSSALSTISSNETTGESSRIAEEVSRLAEETKYYR